jgi:hypothetical protein
MIHITTVHWRYDRWIDIQLRYLERNIDEPYRVYAWLDADMRDQASKFFYSTDVPIKEHELKLTLLGDLVAHAAEPDEMIMFIDGDAFPIGPIVPFLREKLDRYPIVAVRRDENNGDPQPHPLFCAMRASLWLELPGDWRRGHTWTNPQGREVTDVGGNLLGILQEREIEWYPMLRTNKINPHPLQFGVYEDLVYHHGGGFRRTAGGRVSWMPKRDSLDATWRGRLASRLPRRGRLGRLRKRIDPVRRYREALADQLAGINEQVFALIKRDEEFYKQLIDPDRGGELTTIRAPVVIDDVKELSATR